MFKKFLILASILMLSLTAACSAQTASTSGNGQTGTTLGQIADPTNLSVKDKLGIGILSLDKSGLSITSDQAAALLPLWQAVQSLGSDQSAASAEIAALYTQIQEALTTNQIAQIENFNLVSNTTGQPDRTIPVANQSERFGCQTYRIALEPGTGYGRRARWSYAAPGWRDHDGRR